MAIKTLTKPLGQPVTLDEVKLRCRIDGSAQDAELQLLIRSATATVEGMTWRHLVARDVLITQSYLPRLMALPVHPVRSVVSVKYLDVNDVEQTIDPGSYHFADGGDSGPAILKFDLGAFSPSDLADQPDAVRITLQTGFDPVADDHGANVPDELKLAILALVYHFERFGGPVTEGPVSEVPMHLSSLIIPHRLQV